MKSVKEIINCRVCESKDLYTFFDLGLLPIPNGFLNKEDLDEDEKKFPLVVAYCRSCSLTQLKFIVDPEIMFKNYLYIPSASQTRIDNFRGLLEDARRRIKIDSSSLAIDIGSNDGSLLSVFKSEGINVLGVDPAENLVKVATLNGIPTMLGYFGVEIARKIKKQKGQADVAYATNVFAHISNIKEFLTGVEIILKDKGIFISQFPYIVDLLKENQFDTIYHEHLSYFSIKSLLILTEGTEMEIFDIEHSELDGGSVKVYWKKKSNTMQVVKAININRFLREEERIGLYDDKIYNDFSKRVIELKKSVKKELLSLRIRKKKIVGYGAAAKGNIMLNYFGIGTKILDYIVDSTLYKQGKYTPGTHIPIYAEAKILETKPDYVLILAWNFKKEIIKKNEAYTKKGGKYIVAIPSLEII